MLTPDRELLAKALEALLDSNAETPEQAADHLIASGAVVPLDTLADDDAVYDRVENEVMSALMSHGHADGCWPAVTEAALRALAAALSERGDR
jgi:hypothetical protein